MRRRSQLFFSDRSEIEGRENSGPGPDSKFFFLRLKVKIDEVRIILRKKIVNNSNVGSGYRSQQPAAAVFG